MRSATLLAEIMGDLRANDTGVSRRAGHRARDEPRRVLEGLRREVGVTDLREIRRQRTCTGHGTLPFPGYPLICSSQSAFHRINANQGGGGPR